LIYKARKTASVAQTPNKAQRRSTDVGKMSELDWRRALAMVLRRRPPGHEAAGPVPRNSGTVTQCPSRT
jgi:hypothetical protein